MNQRIARLGTTAAGSLVGVGRQMVVVLGDLRLPSSPIVGFPR